MAFEVARFLETTGRQIDALVLLDPPLPGMSFDLHRPGPPEAIPTRSLGRRVAMRLLTLLGSTHLLRSTVHLTARLAGTHRVGRLEYVMLKALRERARRKDWRPAPLSAAGLLVFSRQFARTTEQDWRRLCPSMATLQVNAKHVHFLGEDGVAAVHAALLATLPIPQLLAA